MRHLRSRQPGELRKFIDHMLEAGHLVDDYIGGFIEDCVEIRRLLEILLSQPLRG